MNKGLLTTPPNSQPANPTHGGTAASQPLGASFDNLNNYGNISKIEDFIT
ncbi:MAG: hypothetical protein KAX50_03620 [Saprospiraceae bacterium]|nr:hypothetical protein [Saprospiraceae bacterium]